MRWEDLFDHGILVVSGKGGSGKSTVAATIAVGAAAAGARVLLAEVEGRHEVTRTLGVADPGYAERDTPFGVTVISIVPQDAALEYLHRYHGIDRLSRPFLRSGALDQVIRGAPGFRDLLICGKVYELARAGAGDTGATGRIYDLIVVDAPPTGQLAQFLAAPATFGELVRVGPMKRRAANVAEMFRNRARVVLVATPEEMAVAETFEAVPALAATGVRPACVIANRCTPVVLPPGTVRAAAHLEPARARRLAARARLTLTEPALEEILQGAARGTARRRHERAAVDQLRTAGPLLELPDVTAEPERGRVAALAAAVAGGATPHATADLRSNRDEPATDDLPSPVAGRLDGLLEGVRIVVVCGSGGVGKTTVSAAIAVHLADRGLRTVLLTIDPARRLATALRLPRLAGERTRIGLGRGRSMEAMQLDTKRTFDELVERFATSAEQRDRILGNPFYGRLSDTLGGTNEYMAMEKLHQLADEEGHDAIVIDTPPTRSALSFLDAPKRLTDFLGGRFLRLMLWPTATAGRLTLGAARLGAVAFFRTVGRLVGAETMADAIEFLAAFEGMYAGFKARATQVMELLASSETRFVVVAAPTRPSLEETGYFLDRLTAGGMRSAAVVANRWRAEGTPLPDGAATLAAAARLSDGPTQDERALAAALRFAVREERRAAREASAMAAFASVYAGVPLVGVPDLADDVHDVHGLRRVAEHLFDVREP